LGRIITDFYANIEAHPALRASMTGGTAQIERLKNTLLRWLEELLLGPHDEAYFEKRSRIGRVHVRINLPQAYMFTAIDRIRVQVSEVIRTALEHDNDEMHLTLTALHQIMDIELAIMLETYREDLESKNRMAERLATIGQFAASIGHELRNPLGVMETSVFLLRQHFMQSGAEVDPKINRHLNKIATEVKRSTNTINELLELARSRPPKRQSFPVRSLIEAAIAAAELPLDIGLHVTCAFDAKGILDADQITRVLTNLLLNASQATDGKGHIWIEAESDSEQVRLRVRDDGPGVPDDIRPRVFEALFTTKAKGTGLGLALCRRIVEGHEGSIVLEYAETGASFLVSLPNGQGLAADGPARSAGTPS